MLLISRLIFSNFRAALFIRRSKTSPDSNPSASEPYAARYRAPELLVWAAWLLVTPAALAQSFPSYRDLPDSPSPMVDQVPQLIAQSMAYSSSDSAIDVSDGSIEQTASQPAAPSQSPTSPPAAQNAQQTTPSTGSAVSPELKGETELGKQQVKKQEQQRIMGVIPAFNSVYEGTVPPLTPGQKFQLMFKGTTDAYVFAFAAVTAGIGQAQNSHAGYGQGVEGYAKRFGANYADTADGNFWGNAVLPVVLKEDPRYFRLGHGSFARRMLYSMSTTVWCKRDNGTTGPNYANVAGNFIAGGISNLYYPEADRGIGQTVQSALTVTAEGMIGAALIEFWPDIAHHYQRKKQAKLDAADAAAKNATTVAPPQEGPKQ